MLMNSRKGMSARPARSAAGSINSRHRTLTVLGRRLTAAALLCLLSIVLTWLMQGTAWNPIILPYQLPVLLAGYTLPMTWAVSVAVLAPVLGSVVLGFPSALVMLPLVTCQMIALAAFANFLYTMLEMNAFAVCLASLAFSYVILFCAAAIYGAVSNDAIRPIPYVRNTLVRTWPGCVFALLAPISVVTGRHIMNRFRRLS